MRSAAALHVSVEVSAKKATQQLALFDAGLKGVAKSADDTTTKLDSTSKQITKTDVDVKKSNQGWSDFSKKVITANQSLSLMRKSMGLIKWPAMTAAAGVATEAMAAAAGGAAALTGALVPLAGAAAAGAQAMTLYGQVAGTVALAGVKEVTTAVGGLNEKMDESADAFKNLSPQAQKFARELDGMKKPIQALQKGVQAELFPGLTKGIKSAKGLLPTLKPILQDTAKAIGGIAAQFGKWIGSDAFAKDLAKVGEANTKILNRLGGVAVNVGKAFMNIVVAARPLTNWISLLAERWAKALKQMTDSGRESGRLSSFFSRTKDVAQDLIAILKNVGSTLGTIIHLGAPLGRQIIDSLREGSAELKKWADSTKGRSSIAAYFRQIKAPLYEAGKLLRDITTAFFSVQQKTKGMLAPLLKQIRKDLLPVITDVIAQTSKAFGPRLIDLLVSFAKLVANLAGTNGPLNIWVDVMTKIIDVMNWFIEHVPGMKEVVTTLLGFKAVSAAMNFVGAKAGIGGFIAWLERLGAQATATSAQVVAANKTMQASTAQLGASQALSGTSATAFGAAAPAAGATSATGILAKLKGTMGTVASKGATMLKGIGSRLGASMMAGLAASIVGGSIGGKIGEAVSTIGTTAAAGFAVAGPWGAAAGAIGGILYEGIWGGLFEGGEPKAAMSYFERLTNRVDHFAKVAKDRAKDADHAFAQFAGTSHKLNQQRGREADATRKVTQIERRLANARREHGDDSRLVVRLERRLADARSDLNRETRQTNRLEKLNGIEKHSAKVASNALVKSETKSIVTGQARVKSLRQQIVHMQRMDAPNKEIIAKNREMRSTQADVAEAQRKVNDTFARAGDKIGPNYEKRLREIADSTKHSAIESEKAAKKNARHADRLAEVTEAAITNRGAVNVLGREAVPRLTQAWETNTKHTVEYMDRQDAAMAGMTSGVYEGSSNIEHNLRSSGESLDTKIPPFGLERPKGGGKSTGTRPGAQKGAIVPGVGTGDTVPLHLGGELAAMVEPGEKVAVVNRRAAAAEMALNATVPRFQQGGEVGGGGGLDFALGPYDVPPITYAADHAGSNSHVHISGTSIPWVIAIGRQLQQMGNQVGEFGGPSSAGFGPITTSAHGHYLHDHYSGYAIDVNSGTEDRAWVASIARILGGAGVAGAVAEKIKRVILEGPEGALKTVGQAALDKTREMANRFVKEHTTVVEGQGMTGSGDVEATFAKVAKRLSDSKIATLALGEAGYAESGMQDLPGGDQSSQGSLQLLASTASGMGIDPHDEAAVASAFLLRGFYGRGGANTLAKQGLPAHMVAQSVQGSAFSSGSNYAAQEGSARGWMSRFNLREGGLLEKGHGHGGGPPGEHPEYTPVPPKEEPLDIKGGKPGSFAHIFRVDQFIRAWQKLRERENTRSLTKDAVDRIQKTTSVDWMTADGEFDGTLARLEEQITNAADLADFSASFGKPYRGRDEAQWLNEELRHMWELRNRIAEGNIKLGSGGHAIKKIIRLVSGPHGALQQLKHDLAELDEKLAKLKKDEEDLKQKLKDADEGKKKANEAIQAKIDEEMKKPKKKRDQAKLDRWRELLKDPASEKDAIDKDLKANAKEQDRLRAIRKRTTSLREALVAPVGETLSGRATAVAAGRETLQTRMKELQGPGWTSAPMTGQPLPQIGTIAGEIGDLQIAIRDLGGDTEVPDAMTIADLQEFSQAVQLGAFATSPYMGAFAKGGVALVGEKGPELAAMPSGTRIHDAAETKAMMSPVIYADIYIGGEKIDERVEVKLRDRDARALGAQRAGRRTGV